MSGIGTIVDNKYELLQYINKGGMSAVYLAVNTRLGNKWAIKEIKKTNEQYSQVYINSLIVEANLMKDLDHPAFPRIVDIVDTEECLYLVMDYIEGQTLEQFLNEYGVQDEKTVARWAIELCGALEYLHNQNPPIIYRDMKPSNIIIKPDGSLKIIDFGTARVFNPQKANDTIALGTKGFAPPEQYAGRTDARSDIYALGMTMKYLITGDNPCLEYSLNSYETKQISESMQAIIDRCTAIKAEDRYQNCEDLSNDLLRICSNKKTRRSNNVIKIIIPIVAVIVALGIAVGVFAATRANNNEKNTEQIKETETTISATIESHNHIYTVPDTVGMEYEEALSLLKKAGFTVESEEEYNDKIEYGHVVKQSIQAGEQFEKPQVIVIFVSKGEENKDKDTSDDSSKNSNSNNSSGNNTNGEYSDYNYGNSTVDDGVHDEENSLNSDNSSNGESSKNDDSVSNDMSQDQSSYEHGEEDGGGMNGGDAAAPDQYGLPFIAD